jgi:hypothetical protein
MSCVFIKPRILSWNVRGLNERTKCPKVRNLLRNWKVGIVCLQETKPDAMSHSIVRSLWGCTHVDWCCLDSSWGFRGIMIMWEKGWWRRLLSVWGSTPWLFPSRTLLVIPPGPLQVFMALIRIGIEGFYELN